MFRGGQPARERITETATEPKALSGAPLPAGHGFGRPKKVVLLWPMHQRPYLSQLWGLCLQAHQTQIKSQPANLNQQNLSTGHAPARTIFLFQSPGPLEAEWVEYKLQNTPDSPTPWAHSGSAGQASQSLCLLPTSMPLPLPEMPPLPLLPSQFHLLQKVSYSLAVASFSPWAPRGRGKVRLALPKLPFPDPGHYRWDASPMNSPSLLGSLIPRPGAPGGRTGSDSQIPHLHSRDRLLLALELAISGAPNTPPQRLGGPPPKPGNPSHAALKRGSDPPSEALSFGEEAGEGEGSNDRSPPTGASGEKGPKGGHSHPASTPPHPRPRAPSLGRGRFPGNARWGWGRRRESPRPRLQDPGLTSPQTCVPSEEAGDRAGGVREPGDARGALPPLQTGKVTSTLHSPSSSACPLYPKMKHKAGEGGGDPLSSCAPLPCKALLKLFLPGLTRCCRSAAERPRRCPALRCTRLCRTEPIESSSGAGGGERARARARSRLAPRASAPPQPAAAALARFPRHL